jgi:hypothetical protein
LLQRRLNYKQNVAASIIKCLIVRLLLAIFPLPGVSQTLYLGMMTLVFYHCASAACFLMELLKIKEIFKKCKAKMILIAARKTSKI